MQWLGKTVKVKFSLLAAFWNTAKDVAVVLWGGFKLWKWRCWTVGVGPGTVLIKRTGYLCFKALGSALWIQGIKAAPVVSPLKDVCKKYPAKQPPHFHTSCKAQTEGLLVIKKRNYSKKSLFVMTDFARERSLSSLWLLIFLNISMVLCLSLCSFLQS